ncbi:translation initiation factor eIF3 subunit [Coprinellus micaceus]|uniref:Eukaryotic translation initiation factor 3 subunit J n=1 Tax=Coprinellus micaceus TaxID=71717 RepID=A0A4Y7TKP4_COPMI|nr:translation initiation factor eIF3 subunit [Coprinellus micaceus]
MSDWEESDSEPQAKAPVKPAAPAKKPARSKWEGEDEEKDVPVSDWEESSEEEEEEAKPVVAPPKKKGTLKQKLAEKEAQKAQKKDSDDDAEYDSDAVLDPRAKARRDKERELNADLTNAADLFGAAALGGSKNADLDALISAQPRTKDDFTKLSSQIVEFIIKRHQSKPLYATFAEQLARDIAEPLKDVEIRKVASALTTLANEKQKEARDKASGKKKKGGKPALGGAKAVKATDLGVYDEALDDFGNDPNDFM